MACLESSVAQGRTHIPAGSEHVSNAGVAKLAPPPQRCSIFHRALYRVIGPIEDFLRLSPYGELVFAAHAAAPWVEPAAPAVKGRRYRVVRDATPCAHAIAAVQPQLEKGSNMPMAWTNDLRKLFEWCEGRILSTSAEDLAELSGIVALTQPKIAPGTAAPASPLRQAA